MNDKSKVRIDKWLWAVRVFKTRSQSSESCRKGRIIIDGISAKASREIKAGDLILVKKPPVIYTLKVLNIVEKRLPAKLVGLYMEDITSPHELEKLLVNETAVFKRERGAGRPTKKERREIDGIIKQI